MKKISGIIAIIILFIPTLSFAVTSKEFSTNSLFNDASLISYWKLEDVNDSKSTNNLTNVGSTAFSAAKFNNGMDQGTSNSTKYLTIASRLGITGTNMSACTWVKINTQPSNQTEYIFFQGDNTTSQTEFHIDYIDGAGTKQLNFVRTRRNIADDTFAAGNILLSTTSFTHLCITYDSAGAGTITGYKDGVSLGTAASSGNGAGATVDGFAIGVNLRSGANAYTSAIYDDFEIFSRALTATEVSSIYQSASLRIRGIGR